MTDNSLKSFIRNPLGIIALFITFIYGIASCVLGANFEYFHSCLERQIFIWFIVLFPLVIFLAFIFLVVKHNEKLYAPKDFDDQNGFLIANGKTIKPNGQSESLQSPEIILSVPNNHRDAKLCSLNPEEQIVEKALIKYSKEQSIELKTNVRISPSCRCDAIAQTNDRTLIFEVKHLGHHISQSFFSKEFKTYFLRLQKLESRISKLL